MRRSTLAVMTAVAALTAVGCTYRRTVKAPELVTLRTSGQHGDVVLRTTSPWRARLSPASQIRFQDGAGRWTDWVAAGALFVDAQGVFTHGAVPIARSAEAAQVRGLDEAAAHALERTRPPAGSIVHAGDALTLVGDGVDVDAWIDAFITEVARGQDPRMPAAYCGPDRSPAPGCSMGEYDEHARAHLRHRLGGRPLGTWRFYLPGRGWSDELGGDLLYRALDRYATRVGWAWGEVSAAEVRSLSGGRSLGGMVAATAAAVALAPLALLGSKALTFRGDTAGSPAAGGSGSARWNGSGVLDAVATAGRTVEPGTWEPTVASQVALHARPLFDGTARRRAVARVVLAADVAAPVAITGPDRVIEGVTVAARLGELVEVGGNLRHVAGRGLEREGAWSSSLLGSFYLGGHFFFDARQRVAAPVGVEAGGHGAGGYFRLRWGLRVRVTDAWFVGVYPVNPTFLGNDSSARALSHWSFPSGLEVGLSF